MLPSIVVTITLNPFSTPFQQVWVTLVALSFSNYSSHFLPPWHMTIRTAQYEFPMLTLDLEIGHMLHTQTRIHDSIIQCAIVLTTHLATSNLANQKVMWGRRKRRRRNRMKFWQQQQLHLGQFCGVHHNIESFSPSVGSICLQDSLLPTILLSDPELYVCLLDML